MKQDRIHGTSVADGWAGAVMQKPLAIQKCDRRTDGRTDTARCRVARPRLKKVTIRKGIGERRRGEKENNKLKDKKERGRGR